MHLDVGEIRCPLPTLEQCMENPRAQGCEIICERIGGCPPNPCRPDDPMGLSCPPRGLEP